MTRLKGSLEFVWADVIIYHTPIWWFQVPNGFKKYIDFKESKLKDNDHLNGYFTQFDLEKVSAFLQHVRPGYSIAQ